MFLIFFFIVSLFILTLAPERQTIVGILRCLLDQGLLVAAPVQKLILVQWRFHHDRCPRHLSLARRGLCRVGRILWDTWVQQVRHVKQWGFKFDEVGGFGVEGVLDLFLCFFFKIECFFYLYFTIHYFLFSCIVLVITGWYHGWVGVFHETICNTLLSRTCRYQTAIIGN